MHYYQQVNNKRKQKMQNQINNLLEKEMDRTAFLQHVGIGFLALIGLSGVMKALSSYGNHDSVSSGFGSGSYGGNREK